MKPRSSLLLVAGALLASLLLSGCWTLSLHRLYSDDTLVFDERLVATWKNEDVTAVFTRTGEKVYEIQYIEKGTTSRLDAHLVKLGENTYLDLGPPADADADVAEIHRVSAHSVWKVSWKGDALRLTMMDFDWLRDLLEQDPKAIGSARVGKDFILLTGSTEELQQFVKRHAQEAFKEREEDTWQRVPQPKKN